MSIVSTVESWTTAARAKLKNGELAPSDLDELLTRVRNGIGPPLQRLLYLHAATPSIRSEVLAMAIHEPVAGSITESSGKPQDWPYGTVHDATLDGWQVVHFPDQRAPFDDREIDLVGYEFILQKLEEASE